jgi:hypothetical protein
VATPNKILVQFFFVKKKKEDFGKQNDPKKTSEGAFGTLAGNLIPNNTDT